MLDLMCWGFTAVVGGWVLPLAIGVVRGAGLLSARSIFWNSAMGWGTLEL
ncbi:hypothetical protein PSE_4623 [Pseudovibrio sp. FO-BEG1]|nr:hypothetical protein PSE_4623 [Pseudovibrio sp. FO-BEG1]